jgi:prepilin-type N-terminal cleavage/methylation domain-containing protein
MKKNSQSGFTLIELLVVIAIIGILAAVVLASLNTARGKGKASAVKSDLANARAQASLYYNDNTLSYLNVCTANIGNTKGIDSFVTGATSAGGVGVVCNSNAADWAIAVQLPTAPATYWCVDGRGTSRDKIASGLSAYNAVSGSLNAALTTPTSVVCN